MKPGTLVVSVVAASRAELAQRARNAVAAADVIELRLDGLAAELAGAGGADFLTALIAALPRPVLVAVHGRGGPQAGPATDGVLGGELSAAGLGLRERADLLCLGAHAGASFVDLDGALLADGGLLAALPATTRRVLSVHTFGAFPRDLDRLAAPLDEAARPGDIVKVVPRAECVEDALRLLTWCARRSGRSVRVVEPFGDSSANTAPATSAFCTSLDAPLVSFGSRALAPAFGSALVYAAPDDAGAAAAPGQPRAAVLRGAWPAHTTFGDELRLFGIAGRPLGHSASPRVHTALQRALGLEALFVPLEAESLETLLALLEDPRWRGLSVTAPFKADALRLARSATQEARAIGAANTLVRRDDGAWHAANTDAPAVLTALGGAHTVRGATARVIGAGGAARAAAHALRGAGADVHVAARDAARARALADEVGGTSLALDDRTPCGIVVHTTPLGTNGEGAAPVPAELLRPGVRVLDAVYRPERTALLRRAAAEGAEVCLGTAWFLAQAEAQAALFHGLHGGAATTSTTEDTAARTATGRAALARALRVPVTPSSDPLARRAVVLLGLRGVGKSTVGAALAARLGVPFVDLDRALAERVGAPSAGAYLEQVGEATFRAAEVAALRDWVGRGAPRPERGALASTGAGVLAPGVAAAGVPAAGALATGVLATGVLATGVLATGVLATGVLATGAPATGALATGVLATGVLATGVLATGGGVVESAAARALLADLAGRALVVWLKAPPAVLAARLATSAELRPPLVPGATAHGELERLLERRGRWYGALAESEVDAAREADVVLADLMRLVAASWPAGADPPVGAAPDVADGRESDDLHGR